MLSIFETLNSLPLFFANILPHNFFYCNNGNYCVIIYVLNKFKFVGMNAKCKTQSEKCRNCVAIVMPPSDEGGGIFARK